MSRLNRITVDPEVMGGRPCIRGLRMPVSRVIGMLAAGEPEQTILRNHPDLEPEDIRQALAYAALLADNQIIPLARRCNSSSTTVATSSAPTRPGSADFHDAEDAAISRSAAKPVQ